MATITLKGSEIHTAGELPAVGAAAPATTLHSTALAPTTLDDFGGKKKVLNIFPSIDTPVCATSVRKFHEELASVEGTVVLCISADLPFAFKRFCAAEGIENVEGLSTYRSDFGQAWGVQIADGPLEGLMARAVVVLDASNRVVYSELVPEIAQEPDYTAAIEAVRGA